jgi:hypothetical protein
MKPKMRKEKHKKYVEFNKRRRRVESKSAEIIATKVVGSVIISLSLASVGSGNLLSVLIIAVNEKTCGS